MSDRYEPTWASIRAHVTPQWFRDAKFGIYTHWGVYAVPAKGPNGTWYPYYMYREGTEQYRYHRETYGHPSEFGYKDFIPEFTAEEFDPHEWATLFKRSGAQFAGPVAEHHDGFCMWDTEYSSWNAATMGPKRDVVGQLAAAIRTEGLRFMVALHHAANWWFFPHWREEFDTSDPAYQGLYGELHNQDWVEEMPEFETREEEWGAQDRPSRAFLDRWLGKTKEVMDRYRPDLVWFDFGLQWIQEHYKREMLAHYYNRALEWDKEVVVTYKWHNLVPGAGVVDLELGRYDELTHHEWLTDTTVDDGHGWGYLKETEYKTAKTLVHYLIDNVSKNGYLLLNVGPKPNGEIPRQARELLIEMGDWLDVNGEAIFGTTPWMVSGEGPTEMKKAGYFMEDEEVEYTAQDTRFTMKDDALYAICLGWPEEDVEIASARGRLYEEEIHSVTMLGDDRPLEWSMTDDGLVITPPAARPCRHAFAFKIQRKCPYPPD
ncbi:MAG: alpha-L-fucosidase [Anaerolineae bacterium]